ncbi:hypothetical protein [Plantibacter sp. lyk4-40-MEA-4]|uniref:hypothetical protein n=1 Tax=Plantibacter sp. lyk4-40-MEA-4 TaxID=3040298 RepID=UPI00254DF285|nr:hypothetical protein [Plantibacter sp. lyk4-40-MEA-4]
MSNDDSATRRVRFFSINDLSIGWYLPRVTDLVERLDPDHAPADTTDILELHNVQRYLEYALLPAEYSDEQVASAKARIPTIHGMVARHFSKITEATFADAVAGVEHQYRGDLLDLLGRYGAYDRCKSSSALPALSAAGVRLGEMLTSKKLVRAYDAEIHIELLTKPVNAEYLIRKHLQAAERQELYLPRSLTADDARALLERYIDSEDANPNYVGLVATAKDLKELGLDPKLRLRAKRRIEEITATFFAENTGLRAGCEVFLSDTQVEPEVFELDTTDGWTTRYTYSKAWLSTTLDEASILNNFLHLFRFTDEGGLLVMPSYPAKLSVMERFMGTTGKQEYKVGVEFRATDMRTLLQTQAYNAFLDAKGTSLEEVFAWFFETYLATEFAAVGFSFAASTRSSSHLERVRHLFAEMESSAAQFMLFVNEGEIDRELLSVSTNLVKYKDLPSLLPGKYVYPATGSDINAILHLLFSDQSQLHYISDTLNADTAAQLLIEHNVSYDDFEDYQKPIVDFLVDRGVLQNTGTRVRIASFAQLRVLAALFATTAAAYYCLPKEGQKAVDAMVTNGWVTRRSSLLTEAEADYFNYTLNAVDFSNGLNLRNRYLHGTQAEREREDEHFQNYLIALRTAVALVLKINDEFFLADGICGTDPASDGGELNLAPQ